MKSLEAWSGRTKSIVAFSFLSTYILSFLFEGQILYGLLGYHNLPAPDYIMLAIVAQCLGLATCGFFTTALKRAKMVILLGMGIPLLTVIPFFFAPSLLWSGGLILGGYASGSALGAWGYFLKAFTPKADRLKTSADVLIYSNILMVILNIVAINGSPFISLALVMVCLVLGMLCTWSLQLEEEEQRSQEVMGKTTAELRGALLLLCLFIGILTINSGLMYQVINPAFEHLAALTSWYWAIPYVLVLVVLRNLGSNAKHSSMLYAGMAMMMGAFISFMFLGRGSFDYLVVDTLMLAACGVFDLFWWSILAEMLDYTQNPSQVFGLGLSANVLGVLGGGLIGVLALSTHSVGAEVTVLALTVICVTLAILPLLNRRLVQLLEGHAYLAVYETMGEKQQTEILYQTEGPLDPLTVREQEVLAQLLLGKSNREIAATLYITENTVKTHARNIFSKYAVHSRAELISTILKGGDI